MFVPYRKQPTQMKNVYLTLLLLGGFISCSDDDKTVLSIDETINSGGFIRTLQFNNSDLILDDNYIRVNLSGVNQFNTSIE